MREIKFRGKNSAGWVIGSLIVNPVYTAIIEIEDPDEGTSVRHYVIPDTVGQFTGLKDANGKEIYEGDIVAGYWDFEEDEWPAVVEWDEVSARFVLSGQNSVIPCNEMGGLEVTIIGNVYDNPELLEAQA